MLLGTLDASLLGNLLAGKRAIATRQERGTIRAGKDTIRVGKGTFRSGQNFYKIQKYYQNDAQLSVKNEPKFDGVYSGYNLPKIMVGHM